MQPLLEHFREVTPRLKEMGLSLYTALAQALIEAGIPTHFVVWRVKSPTSLAAKLSRPDRTYKSLWDVTDLVGVRVAVSFEEDVARVSKLIEEKFHVDFQHSSARKKSAGYRSVHYVVSPLDAPSVDFRAEIQIRTALQHAWAEVEHDLGYKATDAVPDAIRERFSRAAGLLEIADAEFAAIRHDLETHRKTTRAQLSSGVAVDLMSLAELHAQPVVRKLDVRISMALERELSHEFFGEEYLVKVLLHAGLSKTSDVLAAVEHYGPHVTGALEAYFVFARSQLNFSTSNIDVVRRGYGLLFVALLSVVRSPNTLGIDKVAQLTRLFEETEFQGDTATAQRVAGALLKALG